MATVSAPTAASARPSPSLPGRRYDHYFFSITTALMLVTVLIGFGPTYYFVGGPRAPLPSLIVHIHGAAFTLWMLLLITQTSLVAAHRTDIHKRLGIAGFALGGMMIVLGVMAATEALLRHTSGAAPTGPSPDPQGFYIVPLTDILLFATLLFFGIKNRIASIAHKRYLFLATVALLDAAVARWPLPAFAHNLVIVDLLVCIFLVFLIAYDLWSTHKLHRVTLWAGAFLIFVQQIRFPIAKTALWHSFANWVIAHFR